LANEYENKDLAAGWTLTHIQLDVHANVPDASQACFIDAALTAKTKCPVAPKPISP
jgi:organic hydroperoxide reductase OsmC/OhrA